MTETLLLTALGGALGILLGAWSLKALTWLGLSDLPRAHEIHLDGTVLALTAGLAVLLGIVVGAVPALQAGRSGLAAALNEEGRGSTAGRGARAAQGGLVVSAGGPGLPPARRRGPAARELPPAARSRSRDSWPSTS